MGEKESTRRQPVVPAPPNLWLASDVRRHHRTTGEACPVCNAIMVGLACAKRCVNCGFHAQ